VCERSYWWVLMILDSLIAPLSVLSLSTGRTLALHQSTTLHNTSHYELTQADSRGQ
jgi:hypothetical protein